MGVPESEKWIKYEPVPEEQMVYISSKYTLCEVLREIYRKTGDKEIKLKCQIATAIGKSMAARITKYEGRNWGRKQYIWNPHKRCEREKYRLEKKWKKEEEDANNS